MKKEEFEMLETFLQYGNLKEAKIVFVGMEEGLAGRPGVKNTEETDEEKLRVALDARMQLLNNKLFNNNRVFVNGKDSKDGWYINNSTLLSQSWQLIRGEDMIESPDDYPGGTMKMLARIHWLLQNNNRTDGYKAMPKTFADYQNLNKPDGDSAMIDIFPFPKKSTGAWPKEYKKVDIKDEFKNKNKYYTHYKEEGNNRVRIIKNLYDNYPINCSIVYAGINKDIFKLESFYESLGFKFETHNTGETHIDYKGPIVPGKNIRIFKIGKRINSKNIEQRVFLTPFFGNGQISNADIEVISTWI